MTGAGSVSIIDAEAEHVGRISDLEAAAFGKASWGADGVREGVIGEANRALLAFGPSVDEPERGGLEADLPVGFAIWRLAADEAEILTIGVIPEARRRGIAACLLARIIQDAEIAGVVSMFLEVDAGNDGAIGLYEAAGFEPVGARARYYRSGADALIMQKDLNKRR